MRTDWNENRARLVGQAMGEPEYSHTNHGEDFFRLPLRSHRLSGAADQVNVLLSRTQLGAQSVHAGDRLAVEGEVRSFNNRTGVGSRLVITLFARQVTPAGQEADDNRLTLAGVLCKAPNYRQTPLGREICDLMLAVNRRYGRADYLPCIAWGALAQRSARLGVGDGIRLEGRLQSRAYTKVTEAGQVRRVAFEVSIMTMELVELPPEDGER
ncbi:MAG TPA: single-stranded DNA-binding protein [Candidatus Onthomonas avicola]|nr:single-stranded DNA-binding protein [Candidatus Onthomonas avicola]